MLFVVLFSLNFVYSSKRNSKKARQTAKKGQVLPGSSASKTNDKKYDGLRSTASTSKMNMNTLNRKATTDSTCLTSLSHSQGMKNHHCLPDDSDLDAKAFHLDEEKNYQFNSLKPSEPIPNSENFSFSSYPVIWAVRSGEGQRHFRSLIKPEAINYLFKFVDKDGRTPLMYACKLGNLAVVNEILDACKDSVDFVDRFGMSALHYACTMKENKSADKKENAELKLEIITALVCESDAEVLSDSTVGGSYYTLNFEDLEAARLIQDRGSVVKFSNPLTFYEARCLAVISWLVIHLALFISFPEETDISFDNPFVKGCLDLLLLAWLVIVIKKLI